MEQIFVSETACFSKSDCRIEKISFADIPHQSKLFTDFLYQPEKVAAFYPSNQKNYRERVGEVLQNYQTDRAQLCDALERINKNFYCSAATLENIALLRDKSCVAIVTGQQAGLFSGSLYTIYKALSTIKVAEQLRAEGIKVVPVFWIAGEDHDFAEVAETFVLDKRKRLASVGVSKMMHSENLPVGKVYLGAEIEETVEKLFNLLPETETAGELRKEIENFYRTGEKFSDAFARLIAKLFGEYGLILLDPLDAKLKKLCSPIYSRAIEKSCQLNKALRERSEKLAAEGYHAQVLIEKDAFPLFYTDDEGRRLSLKIEHGADGSLRVRGRKAKNIDFKVEEMAQFALECPSCLSPNATFRSVVQDFLLPTLCYFGGAAEVAYMAQVNEVYRLLDRPITPIYHRASVTIVEPNAAKNLARYELQLPDLFVKKEKLEADLIEKFLNNEAAAQLTAAETEIGRQLEIVSAALAPIDSTLQEALQKRRGKMLYHLESLRRKFHRAELRRNETFARRFAEIYDALQPHGALQERTLNITSLLARHGFFLIEWLYKNVQAESKEHQILYL